MNIVCNISQPCTLPVIQFLHERTNVQRLAGWIATSYEAWQWTTNSCYIFVECGDQLECVCQRFEEMTVCEHLSPQIYPLVQYAMIYPLLLVGWWFVCLTHVLARTRLTTSMFHLKVQCQRFLLEFLYTVNCNYHDINRRCWFRTGLVIFTFQDVLIEVHMHPVPLFIL